MDPFIAVTGFIVVAVITPGPNNFIVMAAAGRGGFVAALPPMAGVVGGSVALLAVAWAGAAAAFEALPGLRTIVMLVGAGYLTWLGAMMIGQAGADASAAILLPDTALAVAAFQFMNPKAWMLMLTAVSAVAGEGGALPALVALTAIVALASAGCLGLWAAAGAAIAGWLARPAARRWFDRAMGGLLIVSAALLLI